MRRMTMGAALAAAMLLSGCATGVAEPTIGTPVPGEVTGTATVIDDGDGPLLCQGVAERLPPACGGAPITGWDWDALDGFEDVSGVRWGDYRVHGTYDGAALTLTRPPEPVEALMPGADAPSADGPLDEAAATELLHQLFETVPNVFAGDAGMGRAMILVPADDGELQRSLDEQHGEGAVLVLTQLTPVEPG